MYTRLAKSEEKNSQKEFGSKWDEYTKKPQPLFHDGKN